MESAGSQINIGERGLSIEQACDIAREIIRMTTRPAFRLQLLPHSHPSLTQSKLGGVPYWPVGQIPYPRKSDGQDLMLLAQIRLEELQGDSRLPGHGLLQIFIDATDSLSGMELSSDGKSDLTKQDGFRIVWHESIDDSVTEDEVLSLGMPLSTEGFTEELVGNPLSGEFAVSIEQSSSHVTTEDVTFDDVFRVAYAKVMEKELPVEKGDWWKLLRGDADVAFWDAMGESEPQHLMLGYPFFTQFDPRGNIQGGCEHYDTLLIQIDSQRKEGDGDGRSPFAILWGDMGIANFFVNSEAAKRGDFSDVLYNWDCY